MPIRFRDFVNGRGDNVIHDWLHSLDSKARAKVNSILAHLETEETLTGSRYTHKMDGTDHIFEVIVDTKGLALRPLFFYGPSKGEATLVIGAEKKNDRLIPPDALEIAERRRAQVLNGQNETRDHDVS